MRLNNCTAKEMSNQIKIKHRSLLLEKAKDPNKSAPLYHATIKQIPSFMNGLIR